MERKEKKDLILLDRAEFEYFLMSLLKERLGILFDEILVSFNNVLKVVVGDNRLNCNKPVIEIDGEKYFFWFVKDLRSKKNIYNEGESGIFYSWEYITENGVKLISFLSLLNPGYLFIFSTDVKKARDLEQKFLDYFHEKENRWINFQKDISFFVGQLNKFSDKEMYSMKVCPPGYLEKEWRIKIYCYYSNFVLHKKRLLFKCYRNEIVNLSKDKAVFSLDTEKFPLFKKEVNELFLQINPKYGWGGVEIKEGAIQDID